MKAPKIEALVPPPSPFATAPRAFEAVTETHYRLVIAAGGIQFDFDRVRREHHELIGELAVRCQLSGVQTVDGVLSVADFNASSAQARTTRAKMLAARSGLGEADWVGWLEELCQRTILSEREGSPAVSLRDVPRRPADQTWTVSGLDLLPRHPVIMFGDGGSAKSYLALWFAGQLARCQIRVAVFDWELDAHEHRERLERLFGLPIPDVLYARCERPLTAEVDRLRRIVRDERLDYAIFDSIAFASDGPPEAAEVAANYFRALRQLGQFGSLHVAHITKAEGGDQKPFGSAFWHNGARATWHVKMAEGQRLDGSLAVALYPRKANLGPLPSATAYRMAFGPATTSIDVINASDEAGLAGGLRTKERLVAYLKQCHTMPTMTEIADELEQKVDTVEKTIKRAEGTLFTRVVGADGRYRVGLLSHQSDT